MGSPVGKDHPSVRARGWARPRPQTGRAHGISRVRRHGPRLDRRHRRSAQARVRFPRSPELEEVPTMSGDKRYYVTTPIYYVNDAPHIGHAYTSLACDALARFMRLDGYDVHFLTGTDEHGQKVEKSARAAGLDPQTFTDRVSENFRALSQPRLMNFSNDDFIRTTEERHIRACQALWKRLKERGEIYLGTYSGWYAVRDEAFYGEDELVTRRDGRKIAPSGAEVEWVEEPSYFFRLSAWQERLLAHYRAHPEFIAPDNRRNEVISFV